MVAAVLPPSFQLPPEWEEFLLKGPFPVLATMFILAYLRDLSWYRSVRSLVLPTLVAWLVCRMVVDDHGRPSVLLWLIDQFRSTKSSFLFLLEDVVGLFLLISGANVVRHVRRLTWLELKTVVGDWVFAQVKGLAPVQKRLKKEEADLERSLEQSLRPNGLTDPVRSLPLKGRPAGDILQQLKGYAKIEEPKWKEGKVSGAVYSGEEALVELMGQASSLYGITNPLHPDIFPSVMKFEAEICSMVCNLVNGGDSGVVGSLTSGGTESIILAAKTHREFYREEKGITEPEIVACVSAHASIDKACHLMGIRLVKIPMDPKTFKGDVKAMEAAITSNTIMLYASAPQFGQGVIDPVSEISKLGVRYGVGVHVDCCLGGFVLPFAKRLGYDIPDFDFSLPGVTSMSVDTHKYGYASKGTSVVVYRSKALRRYQYFCFPSWPGGLYVTPTIAGSRPGALSAACWSVLCHLGEEGYLERTKQIMDTAQKIAQGVKDIPGIVLQGEVKAMIVCVCSTDPDVNIYEVGDLMHKAGWALNNLQSPPGLHLCCTFRTVGQDKRFVEDLKESVERIRAMTVEARAQGKPRKSSGNAAIYGMTTSLPGGPINEMLKTYTDVVLKT